MKRILKFAWATVIMCSAILGAAAELVLVRIHDGCNNHPVISREIYGRFAEHLGACIYGGLWIGSEASIPNDVGYHTDVFDALKVLEIPDLCWPGGCCVDEYHWMDGVGFWENRPRMVNTNWGGIVEDNSFGMHEFLNLSGKLGCESDISGNVGSGTLEEQAKWGEYMTVEEGPMAKLRKENGREKFWKVKYLGSATKVGGVAATCRLSITPIFIAATRPIATIPVIIGSTRLPAALQIMTSTGLKC